MGARAIPQPTAEWVNRADQILLEHGAVTGGDVFAVRSHARRNAQKVMALLVQLGMHERWELVEHTERRDDGFGWAVELASDLRAPDATYIRQRWVPQHLIGYANDANQLLVKHGAVTGTIATSVDIRLAIGRKS